MSQAIRDEESLAGLTANSTAKSGGSKANSKNVYKQAQVLDLNRALENVSSDKQKQEMAAFKSTLKKLKPLIKMAPQLKLTCESSQLIMPHD